MSLLEHRFRTLLRGCTARDVRIFTPSWPGRVFARSKAALSLLVAKVKSLAETSSSRIAVGLTGGPGVGKSTLATQIVESLNAGDPGSASFVPMDGFHMRHSKLEKLGTVKDKGAAHTFEGGEFVEFLRLLKVAEKAASGPGTRARSKTLWMTPSSSLRKQEFL